MMYPANIFTITFRNHLTGLIVSDDLGTKSSAIDYAKTLTLGGHSVLEIRDVYKDEYIDWENSNDL